MKRPGSISLRCAAVAAFAAAALAAAHSAPAAEAAERPRAIVTFDGTTPSAERSRLVQAAGGRVLRDLHLINGLGVAIDRRGARRLARQAGVRGVTPDAP